MNGQPSVPPRSQTGGLNFRAPPGPCDVDARPVVAVVGQLVVRSGAERLVEIGGRLAVRMRADRGNPKAADDPESSLVADLGVPEAADEMIVDQTARLHQRVADGRPDEAEAAALQLLRQRR